MEICGIYYCGGDEMSEVKRYDHEGYDYEVGSYMKKHADGDYVLHSDYEKLKVQLEKAEVSLDKALSSAEFFSRHADCRRDSWSCRCEFCKDNKASKNLREAREYFKEINKGESK